MVLFLSQFQAGNSTCYPINRFGSLLTISFDHFWEQINSFHFTHYSNLQSHRNFSLNFLWSIQVIYFRHVFMCNSATIIALFKFSFVMEWWKTHSSINGLPKDSNGVRKAFIRWGLCGEIGFRGWSIITSDPHPLNRSLGYQLIFRSFVTLWAWHVS